MPQSANAFVARFRRALDNRRSSAVAALYARLAVLEYFARLRALCESPWTIKWNDTLWAKALITD
jgi:hypothetical protein